MYNIECKYKIKFFLNTDFVISAFVQLNNFFRIRAFYFSAHYIKHPVLQVCRNNFSLSVQQFCNFDCEISGSASEIKYRHSFFDVLFQHSPRTLKYPSHRTFERTCPFNRAYPVIVFVFHF